MSKRSEFKSYIREEFIHHAPYTLGGIAAGLVFALASIRVFGVRFGVEEFHTAHFVHVFFSGAAGAALFKSYRDTLLKAIPIAFVSSVLLCTLSDILVPTLGLKLFGYDAHVHLCVLEHPVTVFACSLAGIVAGLTGIRFFDHCNRAFHLAHILISTLASTMYMLGYMSQITVLSLWALGLTLFFALAVPCVAGDIVLPLCFVKIREDFLHEKVHHSEKI